MRLRLVAAWVAFVLFNSSVRPAQAETAIYALVVGNNAAPLNSELNTLQYADDDAVRYYRFFKRFSRNVHLLTVPDERTQSRYPEIAAIADLPTMTNIQRVLDELSRTIGEDERRGIKTVFYLAFSGHGDYDNNGVPYLVLQDGALTGRRLFDGLRQIGADFQHLFIDACYAEGVVSSRGKGMFSNEGDSRQVRLSGKEVRQVIGAQPAAQFPGLGMIISSTEHQKSHEWSQIESGVFTHEILSGLAGPADINLDGIIEYSELVAFVSVANRGVKDDRAKLNVIAKPPLRDRKAPLVDLKLFSDVAFITGDPSSLGHFYVELENGERYADANLGDMTRMHMAIPTGQKAYLTTKNSAAVLPLENNGVIELARLDFRERQYRDRGNIEDAFHNSLFSAEYGRRYYQGFIDSSGLAGVSFSTPTFEIESIPKEDTSRHHSRRRALALTSFVVAGGGAVATAGLGALTLKAKRDYDDTEFQNASIEYTQRYHRLSTGFWISAGVTAAAAVVGTVLMLTSKPENRSQYSLRDKLKSVAFDGTSLIVSF